MVFFVVIGQDVLGVQRFVGAAAASEAGRGSDDGGR